MLKKMIMVLILLWIISGCISISFDPTTGKTDYFRIGDQIIKEFEAIKTKDGDVIIKFNNQKSNTSSNLLDLLKTAKD